MKTEHPIADEVLDLAQLALIKGQAFMAYNNSLYFIDKEDVHFFNSKEEAIQFANDNISDYDRFNVIEFHSITDILKHIPYGQSINNQIRSDPDANGLYNKDGNAFTEALIDHFSTTNSVNDLQNSKNKTIMDEKAIVFNEGQLKRVGFAEAFTPELRNKMQEGVASIQHPFQKQYDGDQVNATLHLKKSATSDYYFLNKFELELQKEGLANSLKQTFYLTKKLATDETEGGQKSKLENKYTLKEAYNLLAGRPVFKDLVSNEGKEYQAWVKLNFKNQLDNGNYEMEQFTANYGFNLEATLKHYPIKELLNPEYKQSLIDSLNRGNLQKVTFVSGEGKEEKLYVSPHITTGALAVYDANKQRLTTDMLVEKGYIGKELAEGLKQQFSQSQKPEQKENLKQGQKQKQGQTHKGPDSQKPKQSRKQKVH